MQNLAKVVAQPKINHLRLIDSSSINLSPHDFWEVNAWSEYVTKFIDHNGDAVVYWHWKSDNPAVRRIQRNFFLHILSLKIPKDDKVFAGAWILSTILSEVPNHISSD
jgi:hypothetical protein